MDIPGIAPVPASLSLPLPLYGSVVLATLTSRDGAPFTVQAGLSEAQAALLRERSLDAADELLQRQTSDRKRFGEGSYEAWYGKGRFPLVLLDAQGKLAALIWFGAEPMPGGDPSALWDTIAFRSYPPYRGIGIMSSFGRYALAKHDELFPGQRIWLVTDADNAAGVALYEKLGFESQGPAAEEGRVLMIRS